MLRRDWNSQPSHSWWEGARVYVHLNMQVKTNNIKLYSTGPRPIA